MTPTTKLAFGIKYPANLDWLPTILTTPLMRTRIAKVQEKMADREVSSDDDDYDEEDGNSLHPYFGSKIHLDITPKFLHQAIMLLKASEPDKIEIGLKHVEGLILRSSETEISKLV